MLVSLALPSSSEKPSIASYILSAVSVLLGLWLSVAAITVSFTVDLTTKFMNLNFTD